ncbi:MAG TPA: ATP synthase subunit I [Pusillimonas sp.]|uniref:ATP synthase subunit I n=1 Tax=Pusillimonas sp. TaxID=3040095 RepID=UPI002C2984DD|nr:ATP synthase subunit I [Pusillimonas sp.]HUH87432.1 ATP synthase subunit I [Pusillimonas sp.]
MGKTTAPAGKAEQVAIVLSDADRERLRYKAGKGLLHALAAQAFMGLLAALVSWLVAGVAAGVSALIGAGAYFIPNALFAMRLLMGLISAKQASAFTFFVGEFIKLGSAVLLLALAAYLGHEWLVWPALVFGLVCVLKGYVLLLAFRRLP